MKTVKKYMPDSFGKLFVAGLPSQSQKENVCYTNRDKVGWKWISYPQ